MRMFKMTSSDTLMRIKFTIIKLFRRARKTIASVKTLIETSIQMKLK
jgi:hypothetical protein